MSKHFSSAAKNLDILAISLCVLHNYFDNLTKLFSNLYLAKEKVRACARAHTQHTHKKKSLLSYPRRWFRVMLRAEIMEIFI